MFASHKRDKGIRCNRVVINDTGEAVPPQRAKEMGIAPDVIFEKGDKWCLGAPYKFIDIAYQMWADEWTWVYVLKTNMWHEPEDFFHSYITGESNGSQDI